MEGAKLGIGNGGWLERILAMKCGGASGGSYCHRQSIVIEKHRAKASKPVDTKNELGTMNRKSKTVHDESRTLDSEGNSAVFTAACYGGAIAHRNVKGRGGSNG